MTELSQAAEVRVWNANILLAQSEIRHLARRIERARTSGRAPSAKDVARLALLKEVVGEMKVGRRIDASKLARLWNDRVRNA